MIKANFCWMNMKTIFRTHENSQRSSCIERTGYSESGEGDDRNSSCAWCTLPDRCCTVYSSHESGCTGVGCRFLVFSAHKIYGPTGVGVLYGKEEWLDRLPPYQGGGEMIQHVSFEKTTFNELPFKFEAGTPDYIGTTGLAKALDYVNGHGIEQIAAHEHELTTYALQRLKEIPIYVYLVKQPNGERSFLSWWEISIISTSARCWIV